MNNERVLTQKPEKLSSIFWVVWAVELWERFGFYGVQAVIGIYFVKSLGFSQAQSMEVIGSWMAFVFGFIWVGGYIGDKLIGAKRAIIIGGIVLAISYVALAYATKDTVFFALGSIAIGNALFKANPSSLISKLYKEDDSSLDSAMTLYYMAINVGSFISMTLSPIIAHNFGWRYAFLMCALGMFFGLSMFLHFYNFMDKVSTEAGRRPLKKQHVFIIIIGIILAILITGKLLIYIDLCTKIVYTVVTIGFIYYIYLAFREEVRERLRMLIALLLIIFAVMFYALYFQMPTSLTYFAYSNVQLKIFGFKVIAEMYQTLNPFWIILLSPILAIVLKRLKYTHLTKFSFGMTLMALSFFTLFVTKYFSVEGIISGWWLFLSYFLNSFAEIMIGALGLSMVAKLCPRKISGFVMGIWFLSSMIAGPISATIGKLTTVDNGVSLTTVESLNIYTSVFGTIGLITFVIAILMWILNPLLNKYISD